MTLFKDTQFVIYREKKWMSPEEELWLEFCDGYWVSHWGRGSSQWSKGKNSKIDRALWYERSLKTKPDNRKGYEGGYVDYTFNPFRDHPIAIEHFGGTYLEGLGFQTTLDPERIRMTWKMHRVVLYAFKPLDEYSHEIGISKEEWNNTPESVKAFVRRQAIVNHKDHNRSNNHMDNLEWSTSRDNARKKIINRQENNELVNPKTRQHYSELTRKQKVYLGHLDRQTEQQVGPF